VGIPANLNGDAGGGERGQVGRHQRHRAAEKAEGRSYHACPLDGQKFWQPVAASIDQQLDWIVPGARRLPVTLVNTTENLPAGFAGVPTLCNIGQRRNHRRRT
jgi:hypothetical protein